MQASSYVKVKLPLTQHTGTACVSVYEVHALVFVHEYQFASNWEWAPVDLCNYRELHMYLLYPGTLASLFNILTLAKVGQNLRMQAASPMPDVSDPHYPFFFSAQIYIFSCTWLHDK